MPENTDKYYFAIGEVADMIQLPTSTLRYWEREFDILKPKKNAKGDRLFTRTDVQNIKLIHHLVKEKGYTIEGAKSQLRNNLDAKFKNLELIERLKKVKGFLQDIKEAL